MPALAQLVLQATVSLVAYRLPAGVRPQHYDLHFKVVPGKGLFSGEEVIAIKVGAPTRTLDMHSVDLVLSNVTVEQNGKVLTGSVRSSSDSEAVTVSLPQPLAAGDATIHLAFSGRLRDDLRGLYLAKSRTGEALAFTMFEATDARRAFPCFDEPAFKATFRITATVPDGLSALSNAPQVGDSSESGGMHTVAFAETEPISSYLVALAVGRFKMVEGKAGGKSIRVVAQAGDEQLGQFALSAAQALIPWYERYFGVPYPYQKLDLVAVPDFESGAMENAGAIFFRDSRLLLDPHGASVQAKKEVALTVAHEIAHQWFGDLVTMKWWDDLWLNEAFATLMENKSVDELYPAFRVYDDVQVSTEKALRSDSLLATHPIHVPVSTAEEANSIFDEITYLKGSAVLRMLEAFLSPQAFRQGLHLYFVQNARGNATEDDLWLALNQATGKDVTALARSWFDREGYPLVSLTLTTDALRLSQRRFTASAGRPEGATPWQIPFCFRFGAADGGATRCELFGTESSVLQLPLAPGWCIGNAGAVGFYRTAYAQREFRALQERLGSLSVPERVSLFSDTWWLMRSGSSNIDHSLGLIEQLADERSRAVLSTGLSQVKQVAAYLVATSAAQTMRTYMANLLGPVGKELGWQPQPDETPDRQELRAAVLLSLGTVADDRATGVDAKRRLAAYERGESHALDASLLGTAIEIVAAHGDAKTWEDFRFRSAHEKTPEVRELFLEGLAGFRDSALIARTLELVRAGGVQKQDAGRVLGGLVDNQYAQSQAWSYIKSNWQELQARITAQSHAWRFLPKLGAMCNDEAAADVREFFGKTEHRVEGSERPLRRAVENIEICARMRAREAPAVAAWLQKQRGAQPEQSSAAARGTNGAAP